MERQSQSARAEMNVAQSQSEPNAVPTLALEVALRRINGVIQDKDEVVRLALIGFLAQGHVLIEDVPGVGKTTLARALARAVGGSFRRIQLTADLLPTDILGGQIIDRATGQPAFRKGPIFSNIVLADELNRATPRTQSGLLEAMAERSISVDGATHPLPDPFMVIATQNPTEHHGVYPLPESQLDRFLLRTSIGYPGDDVERALLTSSASAMRADPVDSIEPALTPAVISALGEAVDRVLIGDDVARYLQAIVRATREAKELETGVSTRGAIQFARATRARALLYGRTFVTPDDVRSLAVAVCAHRVVVRGARRAARVEAEAILADVIDGVSVPV